jgi:hypothetical protein
MNLPIIGAGREISKDYNEIFFTDDDDTAVAKMEMWMAKQIGEKLVEKFPGRQWNVNIDLPGEIVVIMCPSVSHNKGYHLHMRQDTITTLQDRALMAAGEIMERYGLSRAKIFNPDDLETLNRIGPDEEAITPDSDGVDPLIRDE